ncbi:SusC/RagA family TonB-linked outer membrane protein [Marinoscillum furvescens]|uniref:TonB-linked SusC/RagA family outer membrane protein n=1 Tax=Marinoscillum furvescens DSM 4134 TaxID=1122208 RepID=A0A3D9L8E9_MARFU|nr:TonB-dependent receptor [Marinoscillum furvescens]REE01147.1 TonB-linked SusC/RagA family outer membrane protein [Marinoscillum furvescens DSM 4134]
MKKYIFFVLVCCGLSLVTMAQVKISGTVTDGETGETIPGATVTVPGTTKGTVTDLDGRFTLPNIGANETIAVSFIGYETQKIAINGRSEIDVQLSVDVQSLDEVVVVGYGTQLKRDLTGAVGTVDAEDLAKAPTPNFDKALAGRIAGVQVTSADGTPGANANIVIRGGNSITGDNSPLFVVDGVPLQDFDPASLNTNDIKSFDVLKDASATAIYGSRGANGVILITTKSGRSDGKTDVSFSYNQGVQYAPKRLEVMNGYQYVSYLEQIALIQDNYSPGVETKQFLETWVDPELYRNAESTSWQDEILRQSSFNNYSLSVSGGTEQTRLYYSGQYLDQEGTVINTGFNKVVNNLRVNHKVGSRLKLDANLVHSLSNRLGVDVNGNGFSGMIIRDAVRFRPVEPINDDGLDGFDPDEEAGRRLYDPVDNLNNTERKDRRELFRGTLNANLKILEGLALDVTGSYQSQNRNNSIFYGAETYEGERGINGISGRITNQRLEVITGSSVLKYNKKIASDQRFGVLAGVEAQSRSLESSELASTQLPTDVFGIHNLGLGLIAPIPSSNFTQSTLLSYFGRANYTLKDRYMATVNFRADGSSKFREENRWGYFPSFSVAWIVSEEPFFGSSDLVSNVKLRAGWGKTGNNRIGDFDAFTTLSSTNNSGYIWGAGEAYQVGAIINNLGVPDLKWETTSQYNLGLDYGLFKERIQGEVDLYLKRTTDLLLNADMASSTGFTRVQQNVGEVENKGLEIALRSFNVTKNNFDWTTSFNIAFNRNKVINLNQGQEAIYTDPARINLGEFQYITQVGQPVGQIYGLQYDGLYQLDDFVYDNTSGTYQLKEGVPDNGGNPAPGSVKFVDVDGDGTITEADRGVIGNTQPKFIGGLTNDFRYKGFDLQVFFQWSYGSDVLNLNRVEFESPMGSAQNGFVALMDQWTPDNTDTDIHALKYQQVFGRPVNGTRISDLYVEDGSFLRLKTVSFGYRLPENVLSKVFVKSCRVFVSAQNIFTWTNYSGYDPEVSIPPRGGVSAALAPNLDFSAYPQSVTITGGVNITF